MKELLKQAIKVIEEERDQLIEWANESKLGSWSSHQVKPREQRAIELTNKINYLKVKMHEYEE